LGCGCAGESKAADNPADTAIATNHRPYIMGADSKEGDDETNTYDTIPHLLNKLLHAGKRVPKVTNILPNAPCPSCKYERQGIVNDTYVILCNAEGFYGKTGFMHGGILVCLQCGFISEHIDKEVLDKINEELSTIENK
jgi:hypothetical protein